MDCNAYRIFISGYIDGELADDEMHMLKGHLQTCEACLSYLHRLEHIEIALKRYNLLQEFPGIPPDFAQNVSRKLQTVVAREKQAVGSELQRTFRERVAAMTEKWGNRLSIRPINWATVVSVLLVGIAGAIGFNVFRTMYSEQVLLSEQVALEPVEPRAKQTPVAKKPEPQTEIAAQAPEENEKPPAKFAMRSVSPRDPDDKLVAEKEEAVQPVVSAPAPAIPEKMPVDSSVTPEPMLYKTKQRGLSDKKDQKAMYGRGRIGEQFLADREQGDGLQAEKSLPDASRRTRETLRFFSVEEAQKYVNFQIVQPRYLGAEFQLSSVIVSTTTQRETVQLLYTAGERSLSVIQEKYLAAPGSAAPIDSTMIINYPVKMLNVKVDQDMQMTLIGDIADEELVKIATSIGN